VPGSAAAQQQDRLLAAMVELDELVRTLRRECPWDREQTHISLRRYLLEETYETLEALDARASVVAVADFETLDAHNSDAHDSDTRANATATNDDLLSDIADLDRNLCEELGDLLYQIWFQALLASERNVFDIADVARRVRSKLISRHPHVFGDVEAPDSDTVRANWDAIKLQEKGRDSVMDAIDQTLPALLRAVKVQKRAAAAGLLAGDWRNQEFADTEHALAQLRKQPSEQSFGELLLAVTELGRRIKIDPEDALRAATERARRHYRELETAATAEPASKAD